MDRYFLYDSQISLLNSVHLFHRIFFKFFICRCTVAVLRKLQAKLEEVQLIYEREGSSSTEDCRNNVSLDKWLDENEIATIKEFRSGKKYGRKIYHVNLKASSHLGTHLGTLYQSRKVPHLVPNSEKKRV